METIPRTRGYYTPPPTWTSRRRLESPMSERRRSPACKGDLFHVIHKVPSGDSPYVRAKHVQLIEKDPSKSISLFWAAINAGDRVDSALKDMAIVMKQLNRSDEAIEAIKSFRHLCPHDSQDSLDNVLVELYKRSGRLEEEIEMLQRKLRQVEEGKNSCGKRSKSARSQGKKAYIPIEQERSRILGNMAWAYLQLKKYNIAEELYRKALALEPDKNKKCNLALCLMYMNNVSEAKSLLDDVRGSVRDGKMDDSYAQSFERAFQMLKDIESQPGSKTPIKDGDTCIDGETVSTSSTNEKLMNASLLSNGCPDYGSKHSAIARRLTYECHEESRFLGETRAALIDDRKEKLVVAENIGSSCVRKSVYAPPGAVENYIKSPLTEPRRPLHGFTSQKRKCDFSSQLSCGRPSHRSREFICETKGVEGHSLDQEIMNSSDSGSISWRDGKYVKARSPAVREMVSKHSSVHNEQSNCGENAIMGMTTWDPVEDRSKKCWADMVEEEEPDWFVEKNELSAHEFSGLLEKPPSGATIQFLHNGDEGKGQNDENRDLNIMIHSASGQNNQMESLRQKVADMNLGEGSQTRNRGNQQCFSKPSPLPIEAGDREEDPFQENVENPGLSRKPQRKRLQVFQDITPPSSLWMKSPGRYNSCSPLKYAF